MPRQKIPTHAEKVATLVRIWRAAILSRDLPLRKVAEAELISFGISPADLRLPVHVQDKPEVTL